MVYPINPQKPEFLLSGRLVVKNILLNVIGKVAPIAVGVGVIPFTIQGLGVEQFGILALAWVVLGYFSLFDFGLGQAMTKFVAQALSERNTTGMPQLVWTALAWSIGIGILGTVAVAMGAPFLATEVFRISEDLIGAAQNAFVTIAFAVPIAAGTSVVRGILEGAQRYDFVNAIKIPFNSLVFLVPALSLALGFELPHIILFLVITQFGAFCGYFFACLRVFPLLKTKISLSVSLASRTLRALLSFGGWIAIANAALFVLVQMDRFFIGAILSVKEVGFYAAPFEIITRLLIVPESLIVFLPVFSTLGNQRQKAAVLYSRALKHVLFGMGAAVLLFIFFSEDILRLWLGVEFQAKSTGVLQLLSLGILALSVSVMTNSLINGFGRPDILAKFRALQLPVYALALWFLIGNVGIAGAAAAWMLRAVIDALVVFFVASRVLSVSPREVLRLGAGRSLGALCLAGIVMAAAMFFFQGPFAFVFSVGLLVVFAFLWRYYILDEVDRVFLRSFLQTMKHRFSP